MWGLEASRFAPALMVGLVASSVFAQSSEHERSATSDKGCGAFAWSIRDERAWFGDTRLPRRDSGARLRKINRAVELDLRPTAKVDFFLPPARKPKDNSFSGEVAFFGVPRPGLYQVTLSRPASIEVFENGFRLRRQATTTSENCPGVSKSARYRLAPGDLVLVQVTGASRDSIKIAFAEAR